MKKLGYQIIAYQCDSDADPATVRLTFQKLSLGSSLLGRAVSLNQAMLFIQVLA